MGLSCSCDDGGDVWYYPPDDYTKMPPYPHRRRCFSCKDVIQWTAICTAFSVCRAPSSDIEEVIYGDEVVAAPRFLCERCSDLYFSLDELGFCVNLGDDMRELVREYAEIYGRNSRG